MMCDADRKSANQRCMYECMDRPAKLCSRESGAMDEFLHVWVVTPGGRTSQPCWLLRACDLARPRPSAAPRRLCVRPCVACRWRIRGRDPSSYTVPATHRICLPSVSGPLSIHPGSTAAAWIWQISRKFHRTRRPAASRTCRSIGPPTKPSSTLHFFFICFLFAAYCTPVRTYVHACTCPHPIPTRTQKHPVGHRQSSAVQKVQKIHQTHSLSITHKHARRSSLTRPLRFCLGGVLTQDRQMTTKVVVGLPHACIRGTLIILVGSSSTYGGVSCSEEETSAATMAWTRKCAPCKHH